MKFAAMVLPLSGALFCLPARAGNNALTPEEKVDGYELLWNGRDYAGWLLNSNKDNPADPDVAASNWTIVTAKGWESGDPHQSADPDSNILEIHDAGSSLFTRDSTFLDFDFKAEWQTPFYQATSSLAYYYRIEASTDIDVSASYYAICNPKWFEWKSLLTTAGTGYDMIPLLPSRKNPDLSPNWCRPDSQWNQSRIISYHGRVAHYGNDLRLLEYQMGAPAYQKAFEGSKFKNYPTHAAIHSGSLLLQVHGQVQVKFRNLRVKRLTRDPWGSDSPYLNRDSLAMGDTALIDTLKFGADLFPKTSGVHPYMIAPRIAARIEVNRDGLHIAFSEPGDYTLRLDDVRGARASLHLFRGATEAYLPGAFQGRPRVLTIWSGDKKLQTGLINVNP
jgi:hypothetical protein